MTSFSLAIALAIMAAAGPALAADPAFCSAMCASEQRECRASAQAGPLQERLATGSVEYRNPLARTAQGAVPGQATRALDAAGDTGRRMARQDVCESALGRCTRSCAAAPGAADTSGPRPSPASATATASAAQSG